jgi:hypothetical protein
LNGTCCLGPGGTGCTADTDCCSGRCLDGRTCEGL